jgi:hypothetical protein
LNCGPPLSFLFLIQKTKSALRGELSTVFYIEFEEITLPADSLWNHQKCRTNAEILDTEQQRDGYSKPYQAPKLQPS